MPITYVDHMRTLLNDVQALLQTEYDASGFATIIGDVQNPTNQPQFVLEPVEKRTDSEYAINKKKMDLTIDIFCYLSHANFDSALTRLTEATERLEQLLLNNKKYPSGSGLSWDNSFMLGVEYGIRDNGQDFFRASRLRWMATKYAAR